MTSGLAVALWCLYFFLEPGRPYDFPLILFFLVSSTIRYFSSRSASCCIPGKKAKSQKTRVKTDTRISSHVSQAATCRFLSPQLPVETVTQIDERQCRGLSIVSSFTFDNSKLINWLSIWKKNVCNSRKLLTFCYLNERLILCFQSTQLVLKSGKQIQMLLVQTTSMPTTSE